MGIKCDLEYFRIVCEIDGLRFIYFFNCGFFEILIFESFVEIVNMFNEILR